MADMNPLTAFFGLFLGIAFSLFLCFKVFPQLDQVMKRERGPVEAWICTRFCAIVVALPFYTFIVWMTVVIMVDRDRGVSVIEELCPNDYSCANSFAWNRDHQLKSSCHEANCSFDDLISRSGSHPKTFRGMGLGEDMSPSEDTIEYTCTEFEDNVCLVAEADGNTCPCAGNITVGEQLMCKGFEGCTKDVDSATFETTCLDIAANGKCVHWKTETDSKKQFSFLDCTCSDDSCEKFSCDTFTMKYFYPNVFYAGATTILFILPSLIVTYTLIKTQLRKVLPCKVTVITYDQGAGNQGETEADNIATGGFTNAQQQKEKYLTFSRQVIAGIALGLSIFSFFSWLIIAVSGRVGVSFITLAAGLIGIYEIYSLYTTCKGMNEERTDKINDAKKGIHNRDGDPRATTLFKEAGFNLLQ